MLFHIKEDPGQLSPLDNSKEERRMIQNMIRLMIENDAPDEQYTRLGL